MHLYDFVYYQLYLEEREFEVSPNLLSFALRLGVLPGREYVNKAYRKELATQLKGKIKLSDIKSELNSVINITFDTFLKILDRHKNRVEYSWWITKKEILPQPFSNDP